jgi:hypothetical protein
MQKVAGRPLHAYPGSNSGLGAMGQFSAAAAEKRVCEMMK